VRRREGAPLRWRKKTGLPRHLTVMQSPTLSLLMSTSSEDIASTSADGFICERNLIRQSRHALAPINLAPPGGRRRGGCQLDAGVPAGGAAAQRRSGAASKSGGSASEKGVGAAAEGLSRNAPIIA